MAAKNEPDYTTTLDNASVQWRRRRGRLEADVVQDESLQATVSFVGMPRLTPDDLDEMAGSLALQIEEWKGQVQEEIQHLI